MWHRFLTQILKVNFFFFFKEFVIPDLSTCDAFLLTTVPVFFQNQPGFGIDFRNCT